MAGAAWVRNPSAVATAENLLEGNIGSTLRRLSVPMAVGVVAMIVVNLVDTYWASKLGTDELAAMSFAFPVIGVVLNVALGLMIGTSVAVARVLGAGEHANARRIASHSLLLGLAIVAVVSGLGLATQDAVFRALGAPDELLPVIGAYMRIWYLSAILLVVPMMLNGILRAHGDAITPRNVMVLSAILNAIFDPIFIFGWGPIPAGGLEGAAWATALSRLLTFIYALHGAIQLRALDVHVPRLAELWASWKRVLHVGVPAAATNVLGPLATAMLTAIVALEGADAVAAYGIGARVEALVLIAPIALSSGLSPFIGQNWGAHLQKRVAEAFRISVRFSVAWGLAVFVVLLPAAPYVASVFSEDPEVQRGITLYLRIVPIGFAGYGAMTMSSSAFNAMDHAVRSTWLSVVRSIVIVVPLAWVGSTLFGLAGIYAALATGSTAAALLGMRWMKGFLEPETTTRADRARPVADVDFLIDASPEDQRGAMRGLVAAMEGFEDISLHRVRRDAVGFFAGERELGHIHPSGHLDLPLPLELGEQLVHDGRVEHHRHHEDAGWYTHPLHERRDVDEARQLLELAHALLTAVRARGEAVDLGLSDELRAAFRTAVRRAS